LERRIADHFQLCGFLSLVVTLLILCRIALLNDNAGNIGMKFNLVFNRTADSDGRHESICRQDPASKSLKTQRPGGNFLPSQC
jgi:hypothetical protein